MPLEARLGTLEWRWLLGQVSQGAVVCDLFYSISSAEGCRGRRFGRRLAANRDIAGPSYFKPSTR